ncbi:MAG TPA: hypothetical protein VMU09_05525, partial [Acidimicrobiales bacterium]|nr:hypothetical protein [Acidimicrobiales bacterium]
MSGERLTVSLDVTAVPADPRGAGRYTLELVDALGARADIDLVLWSRRADGERWRLHPPGAASASGDRGSGRGGDRVVRAVAP